MSWDFTPATVFPHTVTECGESCLTPVSEEEALWDSGHVPAGSTGEDAKFTYLFDTPGTYLYYCHVHGAAQVGRIVVAPDPVGGVAFGLPGPDIAAPVDVSHSSGMSKGLVAAVLVGLAAVVTLGGAGWLARKRLTT